MLTHVTSATDRSSLRITFDTYQKVIRSNVNGALKCQIYVVQHTFDPFAKTIKSDSVHRINFATDW